ncbi:MAG: hypothetical protein H0T69_08595 [Thermoleophilaceae bacterium]|nr:hypothetical protein [Thermoleophilaceae bacterium]
MIPTQTGKVEITCAASGGSAANVLALCERSASTLELGSQRTIALSAVAEAQEGRRLAASRLRLDRTEGRATLARARRQPAQIAAAEALARTHERAAARFGALLGGEAVAKAARETAAAYRTMAQAARRDSGTSWAEARAAVRSAEARLEQAIAAG